MVADKEGQLVGLIADGKKLSYHPIPTLPFLRLGFHYVASEFLLLTLRSESTAESKLSGSIPRKFGISYPTVSKGRDPGPTIRREDYAAGSTTHWDLDRWERYCDRGSTSAPRCFPEMVGG